MVRMLATAAAAALTSGLAVLASRSDAAAVVLLLLVLAFAAGLLLAGGPSATQIGRRERRRGAHPRSPAAAGVGRAAHRAARPRRRRGAGGAGDRGLAAAPASPRAGGAGRPLPRDRDRRPHARGDPRRARRPARRSPRCGRRCTGSVTTTARASRPTACCSTRPSASAARSWSSSASAERLAAEGNPILAGLVRRVAARRRPVSWTKSPTRSAQGRPVDDAIVRRAREAIEAAVGRLRAELVGTGRADPAGHRRPAARAVGPAARGAWRARGPAPARARRPGHDPARRPPAAARPAGRPCARTSTPDSAVLRHAARVAVLVAGSDLVVRAGRHRPRLLGAADRARRAAPGLRRDVAALGHARRSARSSGCCSPPSWSAVVPGGDWWTDRADRASSRSACASPARATSRCRAVALSGLVVVLLEINGVPARRRSSTARWPRWPAVRWRRGRRPGAAGVGAAVRAGLGSPTCSAPTATTCSPWPTRTPTGPPCSAPAPRARLARTNAQASVDRARAEPVQAHAADRARAGRAGAHAPLHPRHAGRRCGARRRSATRGRPPRAAPSS